MVLHTKPVRSAAVLTSALLLGPSVDGFSSPLTTRHAISPSPGTTLSNNNCVRVPDLPNRRVDTSTSLHVITSNEERKGSQTGPLFSAFAPEPPPTAADSATRSSSTENGNAAPTIIESILSSYAGPRLILAAVAMIYGTNFPLGALMADALPASAVTSSRFFIASLALLPFLPQIKPSLRLPAMLCGCFVSLGYVAQSLALVDSAPATVSFLGVATPIVVCPVLEAVVDKEPMSPRDAPQTWLAAALCITGVGMLELVDPTALKHASGVGMAAIDSGLALPLLAGAGFGSGCYLSEKMMRDEPQQALPITSVLVATTALVSVFWSLAEGWMSMPNGMHYTLPGLLADPSLSLVAMAIVWTGLISTSFNFFVEISALGRVPSAEASVILATEPIAAAALGAIMLNEEFGMNDYVGGALVIVACLVNTLRPDDILSFLHGRKQER